MALIESEISGNSGILTINNPPFNILSEPVFVELKSKFYELSGNTEIKTIAFAGGTFVFAAGADVNLILALAKTGDRERVSELIGDLHKFFLDIENSEKITIAAVNGHCLGGGLELALVCDYIVASPRAQFGFPEVGLGIFPGLGGTQRLPRKIEPKQAVQMIIGGNFIPAGLAKEIGLVDKLTGNGFGEETEEFISGLTEKKGKNKTFSVNPEDYSDESVNLFAKKKPKVAVSGAVSAIIKGAGQELAEGLKTELKYFLDVLFSEDGIEGLSAYTEKRAPNFKEVIGDSPKKAVEIVEEKAEPTATESALIPPWETETCRLLRETLRDFCEKEIAPKVRKMEKEGDVPRELLQKMAELGFFGISFPEKYGGAGLGKIGGCILADELTYVHPSTAVVVGVQTGLFCETLNLFGNEDQKQRFLVPAIRGEIFGAFSTTEPDIGSDVGAMKTRAKKVDGGYLLNGSKQFITNAENSNYIIVFAQTNSMGGNKTLAAFIVDTKSKGFEITKCEEKMGLHASRTNSFSLENVFVPNENLLGEVGQGFKIAMNVFNYSRITVAASLIGFIRRAMDEAFNFAKSRFLFGEFLYMKQNFQLELAKMEVVRFFIESAVYRAAWMADRGLDIRKEAAVVKYLAEYADKVVDDSLQIHGGAGFIADSPIERLRCDVRVFRIFEGTSQVQLLTLAKEILKAKM